MLAARAMIARAAARAMVQQARRSAGLGPCACRVATEARTATPSVLPICREVVARADATPAWRAARPLTAVLVIGGFASPNPVPRRRYAAA